MRGTHRVAKSSCAMQHRCVICRRPMLVSYAGVLRTHVLRATAILGRLLMSSTRNILREPLASAYSLALFAVTCIGLVAGDLYAQTVVRGPYLQLGTPSSVIVRWRTDVATTGRVHYGNDAGNL